MAHRRSSLKKIRVDKRRRVRNVRVVSELKTAARKLGGFLSARDHAGAVQQSRLYFSQLDKAVKKGILHKNRASRRKSRLSRKINTLQKV